MSITCCLCDRDSAAARLLLSTSVLTSINPAAICPDDSILICAKPFFQLFTNFCFFFKVDLQFLKVLTGIATQGAISKETQKSYYVTTFKLEVSTNGEDWMVYRHGKNHKVGLLDFPEVVYGSIAPILGLFVNLCHEPSHEIEKRGMDGGSDRDGETRGS